MRKQKIIITILSLLLLGVLTLGGVYIYQNFNEVNAWFKDIVSSVSDDQDNEQDNIDDNIDDDNEQDDEGQVGEDNEITITLHIVDPGGYWSTEVNYVDGVFDSEISVTDIVNNDGSYLSFVGWSNCAELPSNFEEKNLINLSDYKPNTDDNLYAVYMDDNYNYYSSGDLSCIQFNWIGQDGGMWSYVYVSPMNDMSLATIYAQTCIPEHIPEGQSFVGWSTVENDLNYIVDFAQTEAVPNTVYFAIFEDIQAEVINFNLHYLNPSTGIRNSSHRSSDRLDLLKDHYDLINPDGTSFLFAGFVSDDDRYELDNADIITDLTNHQFYEGEDIYVVYTDHLNNLYILYDLFAMKFTTADQNTFYYSKMDDRTMAKLYAQTYIPEYIPEGQSFVGWSTVENDPENIVDFENYDFIGYNPYSAYPATFYAVFEDISLQ